MLPNVGPYIYDVSISGFMRSSIYIYIYIYDISSLRVNTALIRRTNGRRLGTFRKSNALTEIVEQWAEEYFHTVVHSLQRVI